MSLKLNSSGGGSITLQEPSTASNRTLTLPNNTGNLISSADSGTVSQTMLASGVAGTGPAFLARTTVTQTLSNNTPTKLNVTTEVFDTNSNYDTSTSRFTPNVAGYYQFIGYVQGFGSSGTNLVEVNIVKNGSFELRGSLLYNAAAVYSSAGSNVTGLLYMNGTTDYVEIYGRVIGSGTLTLGSADFVTQFSGYLVRAA